MGRISKLARADSLWKRLLARVVVAVAIAFSVAWGGLTVASVVSPPNHDTIALAQSDRLEDRLERAEDRAEEREDRIEDRRERREDIREFCREFRRRRYPPRICRRR